MKNLMIVLAVLAALALAGSSAQAGNYGMMNAGTGHVGYAHGHNGFHNQPPFSYPYVVSPVAASYVPVAAGAYGAGYGGGCSSSYAQPVVAVAPAYPTFYNAGVYGNSFGYNPFFFSRFIRGRLNAFGRSY